MDKTEPILQEIKNAVIGVDPNAEVILFGSRARGDFHEESDWDVLVLVDEDEKDWRFKREVRNALYEIELKFGISIQSIIRNNIFWQEISITPLFKQIEKDGVAI